MDPLKKKKKKLDLNLGLESGGTQLPPPPQPLIQQSYTQPLPGVQPILYNPNQRLDMSQYAPDYSSVNQLSPTPSYGNPNGGGNFGGNYGGGGVTPYPANTGSITSGGGFKFDAYGNFVPEGQAQTQPNVAPETPQEEPPKETPLEDPRPYDFGSGKTNQLQDVSSNSDSGKSGSDWWKYALGGAALVGGGLLAKKGVGKFAKGWGDDASKAASNVADPLATKTVDKGVPLLEGSGDIFMGPWATKTDPLATKTKQLALNPGQNANVPLLERSGDIFAEGSTNPIYMRPQPKIVDPYNKTNATASNVADPLAAKGTGNYYTGIGDIGKPPVAIGDATQSFNAGGNIDKNFVAPTEPYKGVTTGSNINLNPKSAEKNFTYGGGNETVKDALAKPKIGGDAISDAKATIANGKFTSIVEARGALGKVPAGYKLVKKDGKVDLVKLGAK